MNLGGNGEHYTPAGSGRRAELTNAILGAVVLLG